MGQPEMLSMILANTPELTNSQIEEKSKQNDAERQALYEEYSKMFPNAHISDVFLFELRRAMKDCSPCEKCTSYPCQKKTCKGQKFLVKEEFGEPTVCFIFCEHFKKARKQRMAEKQFKMAKIPLMYVGKTFEDYQIDSSNNNAVRGAKYVLENDYGLYLFGKPGVGKTFLAAIMAQEFLKRGRSVIFGDVPSLLDQLKGTFDDKSESRLEDLMQTLSDVDVLVLDDLGTEMATEWAVERLYLIINSRYNAGKKMIVTSNYAPEVAAARLNRPKNGTEGETGSRIISRIRQKCKVVQIIGTDKRLTK